MRTFSRRGAVTNRNVLVFGLVVLVVIMSVGLYSLLLPPSGAGTSTSTPSYNAFTVGPCKAIKTQESLTTTTSTRAAGGTATVNNCVSIPPGTALAKSVTSNGYRLDMYLPIAPRAGGEFSIEIVIKNLNHTNSGGFQYYDVTITDSDSHAMNLAGCVILGDNPTFPVGNWDSCGTFWDTTQPSRSTGLVPQAGIYHVSVSVLGITADTDVTLSP
jgi:hypothetical protein